MVNLKLFFSPLGEILFLVQPRKSTQKESCPTSRPTAFLSCSTKWAAAELVLSALRQSSPSSHFVSALRLAARGFKVKTASMLKPLALYGISNDLADVVCQPSQMLSCFTRGFGESVSFSFNSKAAKSSNVFKFTNASSQSLKST